MKVAIVRRAVRRVWISVHPDGRVVVTAAPRISEQSLWRLLEQHRSWIDRQRERFRAMQRIVVPKGELLYRGQLYRFVLRKRLGEEVMLYPHRRIIASGVNLLHPAIQRQWYILEAERLVQRRTRQLAARFGFEYRSVAVKDYASAWGYCSRRKELTFDWRIVKVPPEVMDYLILHELVHTEILRHSRRFWQRLEEVCPRYRCAIEWLRTYGRWV